MTFPGHTSSKRGNHSRSASVTPPGSLWSYLDLKNMALRMSRRPVNSLDTQSSAECSTVQYIKHQNHSSEFIYLQINQKKVSSLISPVSWSALPQILTYTFLKQASGGCFFQRSCHSKCLTALHRGSLMRNSCSNTAYSNQTRWEKQSFLPQKTGAAAQTLGNIDIVLIWCWTDHQTLMLWSVFKLFF